MKEENLIEAEKLAWPELGDRLFVPGQPPYGARLDWGSNRWEIRAAGFKNAADIAVERLIERQQGHESPDEFVNRVEQRPEYLIYPIVVNYRHSIELRIKGLIVTGQELLDLDIDLDTTHNLRILWPKCRSILERVWPADSRDQQSTNGLEAIEACIMELDAMDRSATIFRYPFDLSRNVTLAGDGTVCVLNLRRVVNRVSTFLECSLSAISDYLDQKPTFD
jgi:hypothetical protein